jgi:rhodanese-related sulfurtransferase
MSGFHAKIGRTFGEAAVILVLSLVLAFSINAFRPGGLTVLSGKAGPKDTATPTDALKVYSADECLQLLKAGRAIFLDAREEGAYVSGHLPGSFHVPPEKVETKLAWLKEMEGGGKIFITYCDGQGCNKARGLAEALRMKGIKSLGEFADGWQGWMDRGYPIDDGLGDGALGGSGKN